MLRIYALQLQESPENSTLVDKLMLEVRFLRGRKFNLRAPFLSILFPYFSIPIKIANAAYFEVVNTSETS
jgi:hypothetical protein